MDILGTTFEELEQLEVDEIIKIFKELEKTFSANLGKYQRNMQQISKEDQMGKYKAALEKMRSKITQDANTLIFLHLIAPFLKQKMENAELIHKIIVEEAVLPIKKYQQYIFKDYDAKSFLAELKSDRDKLCQSVMQNGGYIAVIFIF